MWVIHNAEDVTTRVNHSSSDESRFTTTREWFIFFRTHSFYLFKRCCHIIDVPVCNRTSWTRFLNFGCVLAINDAKFVIVVANAELSVCWVVGIWAFKVWLDSQQLRVPLLFRLQVCSIKTGNG